MIYRLDRVAEAAGVDLKRLPYSIRILLENLIRNCDGELVTEEDVLALAKWSPEQTSQKDIPFTPSRVILQDFTGVPCGGRFGRDARRLCSASGGDPQKINPLIPADLVIDHSVQVDMFGIRIRARCSTSRRNSSGIAERYALLRWAQQAFDDFRVVPPAWDRPPGEPRVPRAASFICVEQKRRADRLSRHAGRHRLAHDDDQRPGRRRLGRRWHRGRSRHARPADRTFSCPKSSASASREACRKVQRRPIWFSPSRRCCASMASSASSSSSSARA